MDVGWELEVEITRVGWKTWGQGSIHAYWGQGSGGMILTGDCQRTEELESQV